jgi:hypothetical protein
MSFENMFETLPAKFGAAMLLWAVA